MQDYRHRGLKDRRGVMDLPLKLLVTMVILALCIPVVAATLQNTEDDIVGYGMREDVRRIIGTASAVYRSGEGTGMTLDISVPAGCEIILGSDSPYEISYSYEGRELGREYLSEPVIGFSETLVLSSDCRISITNTGTYGMVEVGIE